MNIQKNISLKEYSNYKIGGLADYFVIANNISDIKEALDFAKKNNLPIFILGGGTNLLFGDNGFRGLVIKIDLRGISFNDNIMTVASGEELLNVVFTSLNKGLSGLEWAAGIPGTVGGAIRGNAGAFQGEMKDSIQSVRSIDIETQEIIERKREEVMFVYRGSIYKQNKREIILEADFILEKDESLKSLELANSYLEKRKSRHPLSYPNAGSIFRNVDARHLTEEEAKQYIIKNDPFPIIPAGYLIEKAGMKGLRIGGAEISNMHANFLINVNNASSEDIISLINLIKKEIKQKYNFDLEEEIQIV